MKKKSNQPTTTTTITYQDLINAVPVLNKLNQMELPGKISLPIARKIKLMNAELDVFNETRQKIISQYGHEQDGHPAVPEDKQDDFAAEIQAMMAQEVDLPGRLLSAHLVDEIPIKPMEILTIEFLFEAEPSTL